ncbi:Ragulator complex protein isoform 2 [Schistosoma japonicum]|uniref:Late endosomal/lysosomal adaptor and MAPK and MTOR activator 5 n=2 Tax=Schistosoma japonicum TaxID=6182 RepID=C1LFD5_SCHJA|nr:Ragulator complex protein isoform 2 [Schistosoma japonicum]CAX73413.1 hypothetical protein [Schistosoma japonicum]
METKLLHNLAKLSSSPKVTAVQCIDSDGLCIASQGTINDQITGILSSIYKHAAGIEENPDPPVLVIEFESKCSILCESYGVLTVVHKNQ